MEKEEKVEKTEKMQWSNMDGFEKTFYVLSIITTIAFLVVAIMKNWSFNILTSSLLYASVLFSAISRIKRNKKSSIGIIVVILICAAVTVIFNLMK